MRPIVFKRVCQFTSRFLVLAITLFSLVSVAEDGEENGGTQTGSEESTEQTARIEPNPEADRVADLAKTISPETEATWLSLDDGSQHLSLYHPASSPEPLGGVVIMPDRGMHADWPVDAHPLRLFLADAGWQTLSIQLPPLESYPIPERTLPTKINIASQTPQTGEGSEGAAAPATPPSPAESTREAEAPAPKIYTADAHKQLVNAGRGVLAQNGSRIVVYLGIGQSAVTALEMASELANENVATGVLLFDAMQPLDRDAPDLLQLLAQVRVPVIDVYTGPPRSLSSFEAPPKQRARVAKRNGVNYLQRRLSEATPVGVHKQRWFSQQVAGLLLRHIHAPLEEKAQLLDNVQPDTPKFEQPPGTPPPQPNPI